MMKRIIVFFLAFLCSLSVYPQNVVIRSGILSAKDIEIFANLSPYSTGSMGFDTRYQGIKGTPRLFDTLLMSSILVRGQDTYIRLKTDIDLVRNVLIVVHPTTGKLVEILSDHLVELIIDKGNNQLIYRTTKEIAFEKEIRENKFYQILKKGPNQFIRIPVKDFDEADYKRVYSPDIRYDEFKLVYRYYIEDSNNIFHKVQLNKKSLAKLFPDKKELINKGFEENPDLNIEEKVVSILEKL
jgi:hypothetical protein